MNKITDEAGQKEMKLKEKQEVKNIFTAREFIKLSPLIEIPFRKN